MWPFTKKQDTVPVPIEYGSLTEMMREEFTQTANEHYEKECIYFTDEKLKELFKKSVKYLVKELNDQSDKYSFILMHNHNVDMKEYFNTFAEIFQKVFKELGVPVKLESNYIYIEKFELRKFFSSLSSSKIDVDEKVRTMLTTGIYR